MQTGKNIAKSNIDTGTGMKNRDGALTREVFENGVILGFTANSFIHKKVQ
jgi:hypothetical protein